MDPIKYIEGKAAGASSVIKHGASTYLVKWPGGERGYQKMDIQGFRATAVEVKAVASQAVLDADQRTLAAAGERLSNADKELAAFDVLLADIAKIK